MVTVCPSVSKLALYLADDPVFSGGGTTENGDGTLRSITLFSVETDHWNGGSGQKDWKDAEARLSWDFNGVSSCAGLIWKSSNSKVVKVSADGRLQAVRAGSATVTARVDDAAGRSASLTVKVINPASSITVVSSAPALNSDTYHGDCDRLIGVGKSVSNKAVLGSAFGKPTVTGVNWSCDTEVLDFNGNRMDDVEAAITGQKLVWVNRSGTVGTSAKLKSYLAYYDIYVTVRAETKDGTGLEGVCTYRVAGRITRLGVLSYEELRLQGKLSGCSFTIGHESDGWTPAVYNVTSSNPKAATALVENDNRIVVYANKQYVPKNGKTVYSNIKITACDGSGKSLTMKVGFRYDGTEYQPVYPKIPWL